MENAIWVLFRTIFEQAPIIHLKADKKIIRSTGFDPTEKEEEK